MNIDHWIKNANIHICDEREAVIKSLKGPSMDIAVAYLYQRATDLSMTMVDLLRDGKCPSNRCTSVQNEYYAILKAAEMWGTSNDKKNGNT